MQVYFLWGNPIVLILVSTVFSIISFISLLLSFISKTVLPLEMYLFIAFSILYSSGISIAFYWAYRHSDYAFMSPKKYKKAMLIYEKNQELKTILEQMDKKNIDMNPDKAIDKAIEVLKSLK